MDRDVKVDPREELIDLITEELRGIREKLTEIKVQIDQTSLVVEREQTRNADLATELRTIQDNLETVPRPDIIAKYNEALEARFRLTTMRGQLEKLQTTREQLEHEQNLLANLLNRLQGTPALTVAEESASPQPALNIVRIVQAQEEERQRLARQMHDGPAQSLTNFILQAEICQRLFDRNPARAAEELNELKEAANVTFQKVREFIFDLRPMMLDDLGVIPTVRRYADSFREKNEIDVRLDIVGEERRLETHREVMLFRAIQELMGLARDYSNPSQLIVKIDMSGPRIKASVEDDGRGFDVEHAFSGDDGYQDARVQGLMTLREKFELVNGSVVIQSSEKDGTLVRLELPATDHAG
ncbi:MAG: sensor histidine kinase [Chloroflexota bacterium]|nr:MAG: histidine kinase [Chloroflexota bacterium]